MKSAGRLKQQESVELLTKRFFMNKTIAIHFDGVIHRCSKGLKDGSIYDEPVLDVFSCIEALLADDWSVYIFSTRSPWQIRRWLRESSLELDGLDEVNFSPRVGFKCEVIPFWKRVWQKKKVVGITRRHLPADIYLSDRAVSFDGNWWSALARVHNFKHYHDQV